jgi:hypothetical protein
MPEIDKTLFAGKEPISAEEWATLTTTGMGQQAVEDFLEGFGWDQKAAGTVGLRLTPDNTGVASAQLALTGPWKEGPILFAASKLFERAPPNAYLELDIDNLSIFHFAANEMWSGMLEGDNITHKFVESSRDVMTVMLQERMEECGIGPFCVKIVTSLAKACSVKWGIWLNVSILIFPGTPEAIAGGLPALSADPAWPGIRLNEGDVAILPAAGRGKGPLGGKSWGSPIAPGLMPGAPWTNAPGPLLTRDVAAAIGALLNTGCLPDSSVGADTMWRKWEKLRANPGDLKRKKAEKSWPVPPTVTAKTGR